MPAKITRTDLDYSCLLRTGQEDPFGQPLGPNWESAEFADWRRNCGKYRLDESGSEVYIPARGRCPWRLDLAGALLNDVLLAVTIIVFMVLIAAPLATLAVIFWNWQKELSRSIRLRQARTTQLR